MQSKNKIVSANKKYTNIFKTIKEAISTAIAKTKISIALIL